MRKNIIDHQLNLDDGTTLRASMDSRLDIRIERNGKAEYVLTVKDYLIKNMKTMSEEEVNFLVCFNTFMTQFFRIKEEGDKIIDKLFG